MKGKRILLAMALSLTLSGCTVVGTDEGSLPLESDTEENTGGELESSVAAYRLMISELERELSELRATQETQTAAYEARIRELEAQITLLKETEPDTSQSTEQSLFSFEQSENGYILVAYHGSERTVTVPQTYQGGAVTEIGEGAFRGSSVEEVILPDGLLEIGWFAFSGCYRLREVTLPSSVCSIGYGAFDYCSASLRFHCPNGSYAEEYAKSYGISVSKSG